MATAEERYRMRATIEQLEARVAQLEARLAAVVQTAVTGIESKADSPALLHRAIAHGPIGRPDPIHLRRTSQPPEQGK